MKEVFAIESQLKPDGNMHITFSDEHVEVFRDGEFVEIRPPENARPISLTLLKVYGFWDVPKGV